MIPLVGHVYELKTVKSDIICGEHGGGSRVVDSNEYSLWDVFAENGAMRSQLTYDLAL